MSQFKGGTDTVRASRAGHTYHERWAARRALQLVFPKDNLCAIVVEGLSRNERLSLGQEAEDIADLTLFYGNGDTFETCDAQQILQFKYKVSSNTVTSSYLKKTIEKFSAALREFKAHAKDEEIEKKLSFGFVTNAEFSPYLWEAIASLKSGDNSVSTRAKRQRDFLSSWCQEEKVCAEDLFPLIEFRASTRDLPAQNRSLRRTVSDWSANASGPAVRRLLALVELVREKAQIEGQSNNAITREDVLEALECDEDQLFPAETRFVDVGEVVERSALEDVRHMVEKCELPIFLNADGGVGKTIIIQSLAVELQDTFEVVIFDCFAGGSYRSESRARHLPRLGLLQVVNELAIRGLCDPLLPNDSDQYGLIEIARKRLKQAGETVSKQSALNGILIIVDAADNAQLEADARNEASFPRLLLESLSAEPIDRVKLLLTARPHRMDTVIGTSAVERIELQPFTQDETRRFLEARLDHLKDVDLSTAFARSRGNGRVLEYLVESWDINVSGEAPRSTITAEELIAQKCDKIFKDLHKAGWTDEDVCEFFAALSLLPPPIPLKELAGALGWSVSQVNSAASDLAPMLELVSHGAIFRDEPTETYIKDQYASEDAAQQSIARRLQARQSESIYAAEALPHFLVVIGDSNRAYHLASSGEFPTCIESEYGRRKLKLARLHAAFSLATREEDFDRVLRLAMKLSQVASANARGDQFIRQSPELAAILGDSDTARRLFNDRSGWRGARDARLIVTYCFSADLEEARIHQKRAIGWINWYLDSSDEGPRPDRLGFEASDIAAVMFLGVLENNLSQFNRNIQLWRFEFAVSVVEELITLCALHEKLNDSAALRTLVKFAASKKCLSLALHVGLLSTERGLSSRQTRAVSRAASSLAQRSKKDVSASSRDYKMELQEKIASAAVTSIVSNSRQSAKRLFKSYKHRRPASYDYGVRPGANRNWAPVHSACIGAWSLGELLSFHHLIPEDVKKGRKTKNINTKSELSNFLDGLIETRVRSKRKKGEKIVKRKRFSHQEREDIVEGSACILELIKPVETAILSQETLTNRHLVEFLDIWNTFLRPDIHWRSENGRDRVARHVGVGLASLLLRHCEVIEETTAVELLQVVSVNRFLLGDKLDMLALLARRTNLADLAGKFASSLSDDIVKDDYIEQRGGSFRDLAASLVPMSLQEAKEYYAQGLSQLDQMGGDDYDLIYSGLHYAAEQPGGHLKPELSHRLMNLCQTIFQHEPSKFGWTLFGRTVASSIGLSAVYKLIRWDDQDLVDYSYGLPQLVCFLAKEGGLDPRRAAVLLTICEDHGWYDWGTGDGLRDLLSVTDPEDRKAIFLLVTDKLHREHSFGGWEGLWESLLECVNTFDEINDPELRKTFQGRLEIAKRRRDAENASNNVSRTISDNSFKLHTKKEREQKREEALLALIGECDPTSASSLDEAIQEIQAVGELGYESRTRLFDHIRERCPFDQRNMFLNALCECTELEFDRALDVLIDCIVAWSNSSAHIRTSASKLIGRLFLFKGSQLFSLRYSGIDRQISRINDLCGDPKFVLQTVLETIAKERLELSGEEWLQLATSLARHTDPSTPLDALEDLLSGTAAKVGDEIGEGSYRAEFAGKEDEGDVVADIVWHLLGDGDAFVRWHAARSVKAFVDAGLIEDVDRLLNRFDVSENSSLASDEHKFAHLNAQQWLLMGLARAARDDGDKLKSLKLKIEALGQRTDLHVVNKLHIARCLSHIEGQQSNDPKLIKLWDEVRVPVHGIVERDEVSQTSRRTDFSFGYEFDKHEVWKLSYLFSISENEARDRIADEVTKRWPGTSSMSDFPGGVRYQPDERFETFGEHVQKHAYLHAVTTLLKNVPVARSSYDCDERNPWEEFLREVDVSFEDGSWLSDHKDDVPSAARERLLAERNAEGEALLEKTTLFRKVGLSKSEEGQFIPIYGHWTSPDNVHVYLTTALTRQWGAVGRCERFSKLPDHDLWLPRLGSDGRIDRFTRKNSFYPLIWDPEKYPIGIDQNDKWATTGTRSRPRLGLALSKVLGLVPDAAQRMWFAPNGQVALKSEVWGVWRSDGHTHRQIYQDDGVILWTDRHWLDQILDSCKRSVVFNLSFSKSKSSRSYDDSSGVREKYVGLKLAGESPRFWFARKASETEY